MSMTSRLEIKIKEKLKAVDYQIINESEKHHGHAGDNGSGESHFKVIITSPLFNKMSRLERQRYVYDVFKEEIEGGIHAISLVLRPFEL